MRPLELSVTDYLTSKKEYGSLRLGSLALKLYSDLALTLIPNSRSLIRIKKLNRKKGASIAPLIYYKVGSTSF
jgi:hypothetical protein